MNLKLPGDLVDVGSLPIQSSVFFWLNKSTGNRLHLLEDLEDYRRHRPRHRHRFLHRHPGYLEKIPTHCCCLEVEVE